MKGILLFLCMALGVCACKNKDIEGPQSDTVRPSTHELAVEAGGGTCSLTTEGRHWWLTNCVDIDNEPVCEDKDHLILDVKLGDPSKPTQIKELAGAWFTVTKETPQKLVFEAKPNETGKARTLRLHLANGNNGVDITLTQAAE
jgi:hypothetical protein